jgi:hypothetical protein
MVLDALGLERVTVCGMSMELERAAGAGIDHAASITTRRGAAVVAAHLRAAMA